MSPLVAALPPRLASAMRPVALSARQHLFRQGDAASALYLLRRGRVAMQRHLPDGAAVKLHVARPGETFAEAALFADSYQCDAVAETDSLVAAIPTAGLRAALAEDGQLSALLLAAFAGQVHRLRGRLELRNIRPAEERVLAWLRLEGSGRPPCVALGGRSLMSVAAELGLAHEVFYRALAKLQRAGRIVRRPDGIALGPVSSGL